MVNYLFHKIKLHHDIYITVHNQMFKFLRDLIFLKHVIIQKELSKWYTFNSGPKCCNYMSKVVWFMYKPALVFLLWVYLKLSMRNMLSKHCAPHASGAMYEWIIILSLFIAISFTVHMTSLHVRCICTLFTLKLFFTFKFSVFWTIRHHQLFEVFNKCTNYLSGY